MRARFAARSCCYTRMLLTCHDSPAPWQAGAPEDMVRTAIHSVHAVAQCPAAAAGCGRVRARAAPENLRWRVARGCCARRPPRGARGAQAVRPAASEPRERPPRRCGLSAGRRASVIRVGLLPPGVPLGELTFGRRCLLPLGRRWLLRLGRRWLRDGGVASRRGACRAVPRCTS